MYFGRKSLFYGKSNGLLLGLPKILLRSFGCMPEGREIVQGSVQQKCTCGKFQKATAVFVEHSQLEFLPCVYKHPHTQTHMHVFIRI